MADNPIDLTKIFNFRDTDPLDQVIAKTQQFNAVLEQMLQTAQKSAQGTIASMQAIQKSVDSLEAEITQADATTKKGQETIANGATTTAKAVAQNEEYKKSLADLNTTIKTLQEQIDKLSESNKKVSTDGDKQSASLAELKKQLKDATDAYMKLGASVDSSVKADALKKVVDLNKAVQDGTKVINDAKKSVDLANGSYNELAAKVAAATKQLKAMEGGVGSNSEQFKSLQKFVAEGNEKLKEFDDTIGVSVRHVGGYREAIEAAIPAFAKLNPELVELGEAASAMGKKFLTLLVHPVVLGIAAIIAAFAFLKNSYEAFAEGTVTGADRAERFGLAWSTALELVKVQMKALGKSISDFLDNSGISDFFAQSLVYIVGGTKALGDYNARLVQNTEILKLQQELRKEEISLTVESAKLELEKQEELFKARDKAGRDFKERYEALLKANKAIEEEIALKLKSANLESEIIQKQFAKKKIQITAETDLAELFKSELATNKLSYEQFEQLAAVQKKLIDIEAERYAGARRRQALMSSLTQDETQMITQRLAIERESIKKDQEEQIKSQIQTNTILLENESLTLSQKLELFDQNDKKRIELIELNSQNEIEQLKEKFKSIVELNSTQYKEIEKLADGDLFKRSLLEKQYKEKAIEEDIGFQNAKKRIINSAALEEYSILEASAKARIDLAIKTRQAELKESQSQGNVERDEAVIALNESLKNREISITRYNLRRRMLENIARQDSIANEIQLLEEKAAVLGQDTQNEMKHKQEIIAIEEEITKKKKEQSDLQIEITKKKGEQIYELEKRLANAVLSGIISVSKNETDARLNAIDEQLSALQEQSQKEIDLAGNNEQAKAQINARAKAQEEQLKKEQKKLRHDEAVFEKRLNEAKIIMNTAVQISENLYNPVAVAIIAALGAIELAVVESTPIPAYARGTDWAKEGLALVAEQGPEIGIDRSGKAILYEEKQITYLTEGTKILNNAKTEPILDKMDTKHMDLISHQLIDIGIRDIKAGQSLNREVINKLDEVKEVTKKNKPAQVNYAKVGALVYEFKEEEKGYVKRTKALSMGSWL